MSEKQHLFSTGEKEKLVNAFMAYLSEDGKRFRTAQTYGWGIRVYLGWLQQENIHYERAAYQDLLVYVDLNKKNGNTTGTINQKLQGIRHFYNFLQAEGRVKTNPCAELRIKGAVKRLPHDLLNWEELRQIYSSYPSEKVTGKRDKVILGMLIYQGLNSGEIARLKVTDVKLEEGKVYVPQVSRSNSRTLTLESTQILLMQKYITDIRPVILVMSGKTTDKLFISIGSGYRLDNSLSRLIKKAGEINPKVKNVKQIRASVITHWLKNKNIREVQYMSGHRYVSSTEFYRTDNLESLQEQVDELHPLG